MAAVVSPATGTLTRPSSAVEIRAEYKAVSGQAQAQIGGRGSLGATGLRWSAPSSESVSSKRGNLCIVAASPPKKNDVAGQGREALTRHDLVAYLASGCKPKEKWRSVNFILFGILGFNSIFFNAAGFGVGVR